MPFVILKYFSYYCLFSQCLQHLPVHNKPYNLLYLSNLIQSNISSSYVNLYLKLEIEYTVGDIH